MQEFFTCEKFLYYHLCLKCERIYMSYRIGSFNLCNFNYGKNEDGYFKDFEKIAEIIRENNFDIVALQEIRSESAGKRIIDFSNNNPLMNRLDRSGFNYGFCYGYSQSNSTHGEGYAFIWNKRTMKLKEIKNKQNPVIFGPSYFHLLKDIQNVRGELARYPLYAIFTPLNLPKVEIRLINIHIMYSKNNKIKSEEENVSEAEKKSALEYRKNEFRIATEGIYKKIATTPGDGSVFYTILLGDYNLTYNQIENNLSIQLRKQLQDVYLKDKQKLGYHYQSINLKTIQFPEDKETTLSKLPKDPEKFETWVPSFVNDYDHFTYDENRFEGIGVSARTNRSAINLCKGETYKDKFKKYRETVSDHIPISMDIDLRNERL